MVDVSFEPNIFSENRINDRIEPVLRDIEGALNQHGSRWPVAVITAPVRALYGACEVLCGLGLAFFKLLDTIYTLTRYGATRAYQPLQECNAALSYTVHGAANIFRAFLEISGVMTILAWRNEAGFGGYRMPYAIETANDFGSIGLAPLPTHELGGGEDEDVDTGMVEADDLPFIGSEHGRVTKL